MAHGACSALVMSGRMPGRVLGACVGCASGQAHRLSRRLPLGAPRRRRLRHAVEVPDDLGVDLLSRIAAWRLATLSTAHTPHTACGQTQGSRARGARHASRRDRPPCRHARIAPTPPQCAPPHMHRHTTRRPAPHPDPFPSTRHALAARTSSLRSSRAPASTKILTSSRKPLQDALCTGIEFPCGHARREP